MVKETSMRRGARSFLARNEDGTLQPKSRLISHIRIVCRAALDNAIVSIVEIEGRSGDRDHRFHVGHFPTPGPKGASILLPDGVNLGCHGRDPLNLGILRSRSTLKKPAGFWKKSSGQSASASLAKVKHNKATLQRLGMRLMAFAAYNLRKALLALE